MRDANARHGLVAEWRGAILSPPADVPFGSFVAAADPDGDAIAFHTARG